jgi:outer membrane protein assembly factor BamD
MQKRNFILAITASLLALMLVPNTGFGFPFPFKHKKYEAPISKETLQPDKVLFDRAIKDIEHGNYESARLVLNTLINTYDTSEYLAKAKLAIADSWYREGGAHGLAQAEAEYKDFILFYPNMEEAAQSQYKVCEIHYKQMEKADRDASQAQRAEDECRQVLKQFPNATQYIKSAEQKLRDVQEVLADKEFRNGDFYHHKGAYPAAASRFAFLTKQYPLYSGADQALWEEADSYHRMGDRFETQEGDALASIVKNYPLSAHVDEAKTRLQALKREVPQADAAAYARQKYDLENRTKPGIVHRSLGIFSGSPDTNLAAKNGTPAMETLRPAVPVSVPAAAAGGQTGVSDVVGGIVNDSSNLDKSPDARLANQNGVVAPEAIGTGEQKASVGWNGQDTAETKAAVPAFVPPPTNHPLTTAQIKQIQKAQERAQKKAAAQAKKKGAQPVPQPPVNGVSTDPNTTAPTTAVPAATTPAPAATTPAKP